MVEQLPARELPAAQGDPAPVDRDPKGRVTSSEAARRLAQRPRRRDMVPRAVATDPRFAVHDRRRREWTRTRRSELHDAHGGVSAGVGALVVAAGWLHAAGECAAEMAAQTLDYDLFRTAAHLTAAARQHELAAWELAAREAELRKNAPGQVPAWRQRITERAEQMRREREAAAGGGSSD